LKEGWIIQKNKVITMELIKIKEIRADVGKKIEELWYAQSSYIKSQQESLEKLIQNLKDKEKPK
jgi:hypothetical protein